MRVDLKKFVFIGPEIEKDAFFAKAQEAGIIHFISKAPKSMGGLSHEVEKITLALKILRGLPPLPQETFEEYLLGDGIAYKIVDLHNKIEHYHEELRTIQLEIARVKPFGDFSLDEIRKLEVEGKRVVQFFCARPRISEEGQLPETAIFIDSDQGLDYYISISPEPLVRKDMIEMQIDRPLSVLEARRHQVNQELEHTERQLKTYAKYDHFLHDALLYRLDRQNLEQTTQFAQDRVEGELFAIEGWTPLSKIDEMKAFVDKLHVFVEEVAVENTDAIPTCLENEGLARVGEDLVHIYDTPSHEDKDPSLWVLFSFSLFFAFIIGDGGYGLIFLATALYLRYRMGSKLRGVGKRVWKLFLVLSIACVMWGFATNSFFASSLSPANPIRAYSPLTWLAIQKIGYEIDIEDETYLEAVKKYSYLAPITDPREFLFTPPPQKEGDPTYELADSIAGGILMELALVIGIVHIILSMLRYVRRNWAMAGWVFVLVGAFLYFPVYLGSPSFLNYVFGLSPSIAEIEGLYLMGGGAALAIVLALIQHRWMGIFEPMTAVQILADVLSYLRLYALGLAGSIVAATINEFVVASGFVLGILLALFGHSINITLSIMGGVVHGLRLNFIEWYHYSFYGGGRKYSPLRKLSNFNKENENEL